MAQYNFSSPLASFGDALHQEMLRREMQKRQDMLDALRVQEQQSQQQDRLAGRQAQQRGLDLTERNQNLQEQQRADLLTQRQQEHDDALAAVAPPEPGMTGNVPSQFAQPMDNTADMGGLSVTAPTAGGSLYQAERRKAADAMSAEQARLTAASQDKADQQAAAAQAAGLQRDFLASENAANRSNARAIADANRDAKGNKPATDAQTTAAGYADRIAESMKTLDATEKDISGRSSLGGFLSGLVPNDMRDSTYQQTDQAGRNFINAVLRKESGAAISKDEFDNARQQYLPQPGDSPNVLAQKRQARTQALANMQRSAGKAGTTNTGGSSDIQSLRSKYGY